MKLGLAQILKHMQQLESYFCKSDCWRMENERTFLCRLAGFLLGFNFCFVLQWQCNNGKIKLLKID